jgi:thioredoxin 1
MAPWERILAAVLVLAALLTVILFLIPTSDILRIPNASALSADSPLPIDEGSLSAALGRFPLLALDCYYPGCAPCKEMNQTIEELSAELHGQVVFGLINAMSNQNFTNLYQATNYPTLFLFKDGTLFARLVGDRSKGEVLAELRKLKPDLDESKVKNATAAPQAIVAVQELSLARLGEKSPDKPMPIKDSDLQMALDQYPFMVLDAYVTWCDPCHRMNQTVLELSRELQGQVAFGALNVGFNPETKRRYNISAYPTFLIFDNGRLISTLIGTRSSASFLQELKGLHPSLQIAPEMLAPLPTGIAAAAKGTPEIETSPPAEKIPLSSLGENNPRQPMLLTERTLSSAINQYPFLVVEGYATWCGYSHLMNATLTELAGELQGQVAFGLIDAANSNKTKIEYNISAYPTLLIFKDGKLADRVIGYQQKSSFIEELKKIYPGLDTSNVKMPPPPVQPQVRPKLTPAQVCANMTKSDHPVLEAFVVSRCPFGLQMQRIMADLISSVPEAEDSLRVMYIGSVSNGTIASMHGEEEAQENARQICIREEQPGMYWDYLRCYIKEGRSEDCLSSASIDQDKLNSCLADPTRGLAYAQKDFDLADRFGITGSPTLVLNDQIARESDFATAAVNARSPEALKDLLCCGFKSQPAFCSITLNGTRAATMFSAS